MKAASVKQIRDELKGRTEEELREICLRLSRFKKENKELLTYLLFEADDEHGFVVSIKEEMDELFEVVNRQNYYIIKKGIRKILTGVKRHVRYSNSKETEVQLLIYFCEKMKEFRPSIWRSQQLENMYNRQLEMAKKKVKGLHEDLQHDYGQEILDLMD